MLISGRTGVADRKMGITVKMKNGKKIDGESFVVGMAASELSYIKEEEALKAWMIVCRTNFRKAAGHNKEIRQSEMPLDFVSMKSLEENNGRKTYLALKKQLEDASDDTFGQILCYKGKCIDALYHQVSIGKTVSSAEIYSVEVPYLVSVDSSQDVESNEYMNTQVISFKECLEVLDRAGYKESEENLKKNLKISSHTKNGFVEEVSSGKNRWTGEKWKKLFALHSTNFYLENYKGKLRIVTIGKGHGMGMSLYGANQLAKKGIRFPTILSYYYPGTAVEMLK